MIWPFPKRTISSGYGWRVHPDTGAKSYHSAIDFGVPGGSTVRAIAAGTVAAVDEHPQFGHRITIAHANGFKSKYWHLRQRACVDPGDLVDAGQPVGIVGSSGTAARGDHLHLEIWRTGRHYDPTLYLDPLTPQETR